MFKKFIAVSLIASSLCSFAQDKMTPELLWKLGRVSGETISPDGESIVFGITRYNIEDDKGNRDLFSIPIKGGEVKQLTNMPGSEYNVQYRPDGKKIGFLSKGQIWEMDLDGSNPTQISNVAAGISHFKYAPKGDKVA